ncbi:hypothetical protein Enr13x_24360 [Stieleria neptunia]|uniref:SRPBCC domain-containing protein n=1 Tax=Stieleria neptunia TaxID=2527979 RepID=A0A518HP19_9BACT|nr:SRPBCC domain-containing protein [Stieleria neptunia]QDV42588.1 hypothetical protein Enr13x_24360 [Stieleria neptunia]
MSELKTFEIGCVQYELEIEIKADRTVVWKALIEQPDRWWLPDFRMVDEASTVEFDVRPGGHGLIESRDGGGFLVWYTIQFYQPDEFKIYLVGNVAPDWGGPSTSNLCLSLDRRGDGSVLKLSDTHHGHVSEAYMGSLKDGWAKLFGEGLRRHVESVD